jgi:hypothetical protein
MDAKTKSPAVAETAQGASAPAKNPPRLQTPAPAGQAAPAPAPVHAATAAIKHGANPSGRKTLSGFPVGSPEHLEWVRKNDRERKAVALKIAKQITQPPPLPRATSRFTILARAPDEAVRAVDGAEPFAPPVEVVPWLGEDLDSTVELLVEVLEEADVAKAERMLLAANVGPNNTRDLVKDARYPAKAKSGLQRAGGSALADGLNMVGVSAKHKYVPLAITSAALIIASRTRFFSRLEKVLKASQQPIAPKPGEQPKQ